MGKLKHWLNGPFYIPHGVGSRPQVAVDTVAVDGLERVTLCLNAEQVAEAFSTVPQSPVLDVIRQAICDAFMRGTIQRAMLIPKVRSRWRMIPDPLPDEFNEVDALAWLAQAVNRLAAALEARLPPVAAPPCERCGSTNGPLVCELPLDHDGRHSNGLVRWLM